MELKREELEKKDVPELLFIFKQKKAEMLKLREEREKLEKQLQTNRD